MIKMILPVLAVGCFSSAALAQRSGSPMLRQVMTSYMQYDISSSTYESDAAASKDTAESSTFTFGTHAGFERLVGIQLRSNRSDVKFALNGSKMVSHWRDLALGYRLGWFEPALYAGLSEIQIERANAEYVDIYRASLGAGLSFSVPLWEKLLVYSDVRFFEKPELPRFAAIELNSQDAVPEGTPRKLVATLGSRSEADIGASVDIVREYIDFVVGYRVKSYTLVIEEEEQSEYQAGLYAGFKLGAYF